jgi:hypothetical protein
MDSVTIARNLILLPGSPVTSGTISFATGATAATTVSADIATPIHPVSKYVIALKNNATQTTISVQAKNVRTMNATSVAFELTSSITCTTGQLKDTLVEGLFVGGATGCRLLFSLGSAATAAEVVSADYQIWPLR